MSNTNKTNNKNYKSNNKKSKINNYVILQPLNIKFNISNIKLIGKGHSSDVYLFINDNKKYIMKCFKEYNNKHIKEFTYLSNIFDYKSNYKVYGYSDNQIIINNLFVYNCYYIADYIDGITLTQFLKSNSIYDNEDIYYKILEYIDYMNDKHIIHNDLITDNIIIDKNREIYIIDYGESYTIYKNVIASELFINSDIIKNINDNDVVLFNEKEGINYLKCNKLLHINSNDNNKEIINDFIELNKLSDKMMILFNTFIYNNNNEEEKIKICIDKMKEIIKTLPDKYVNKLINFNEDIFKYLLKYKYYNRFTTAIYMSLLLEYNLLTSTCINQINNILYCINNDKDIIEYLKMNDNDSIYDKTKELLDCCIFKKNIIDNYNLFDKILLCNIHFTLNIYNIRRYNDTTNTFFSFNNEKIYNYIKLISDFNINDNKIIDNFRFIQYLLQI